MHSSILILTPVAMSTAVYPPLNQNRVIFGVCNNCIKCLITLSRHANISSGVNIPTGVIAAFFFFSPLAAVLRLLSCFTAVVLVCLASPQPLLAVSLCSPLALFSAWRRAGVVLKLWCGRAKKHSKTVQKDNNKEGSFPWMDRNKHPWCYGASYDASSAHLLLI